MEKQPRIPGIDTPRPTLQHTEITKLEDRLLRIELEVSLLRILVEKGERAST